MLDPAVLPALGYDAVRNCVLDGVVYPLFFAHVIAAQVCEQGTPARLGAVFVEFLSVKQMFRRRIRS